MRRGIIVMDGLKFAYIPGAAAFALSLLTGILFGVGFLALLLRAIGFGLLFAAAGFGVRSLFVRFLPELFEADQGDEEDGTIADAAPAADTESDRQERMVDIVVEDDDDSTSSIYRSEQEEEQDSFVDTNGGDEGDDDMGTLEAVSDDEDEGNLPDLDSFSDSFQSVAASQEEVENQGGTSPGSEVDFLGTSHDPATVAKAVRTFMKKDQEG
jgi:hypothetical protein